MKFNDIPETQYKIKLTTQPVYYYDPAKIQYRQKLSTNETSTTKNPVFKK